MVNTAQLGYQKFFESFRQTTFSHTMVSYVLLDGCFFYAVSFDGTSVSSPHQTLYEAMQAQKTLESNLRAINAQTDINTLVSPTARVNIPVVR